ncbi:MAG TPA: HypC/HybG/HupF family hydrogenase formation chaperone [Firmicutes bacterium]|jgi:hydrogenase expression/formation protein HypC|nr:HypC/HybG/HupF family hydrogenase formation chaperone [Bacillota bacterium]
MCLGIPVQVVKTPAGGAWAVVETSGIRQQVSTELVGPVKAGDWLLIHAGYAIAQLDFEAAADVLDLLAEMGLENV